MGKSEAKPLRPRPFTIVGRLTAEFVGDILYVFIGSLCPILGAAAPDPILHAALTHGLAAFVLASSLGPVSGAHFNPAVTWAVAISGRMDPRHVLPYWLVQLGGGFVGALLVRAVLTQGEYDAILGGATLVTHGQLWYQGLLVELILTLLLAQTVLMSAVDTDENKLAPLAIGMTIAADVFAGGSISAASMNPARSFGPCLAAQIFASPNLISSLWTAHYIYWAGPMLGASLAAFLYSTFFSRTIRVIT